MLRELLETEQEPEEEVVIRIPEAGDSLLTVQELSEILDVPEQTLRDWALMGQGPQLYGWARTPFYRVEEVLLWLMDQPGHRSILVGGNKVTR